MSTFFCYSGKRIEKCDLRGEIGKVSDILKLNIVKFLHNLSAKKLFFDQKDCWKNFHLKG